jgi:tRNA (guanine-N7-)-methyltransferase
LRKIRQHVNPLGEHFMRVRARPALRPAGLDPACRVEVELGCADAEFSFQLATNHPESLVVGVEIREPCLERNRERVQQLGLGNLVFAYSNLNVDLDQVFAPRSVDCFHLLFPDPWFKERHRKRRVIEPELVRVIASQLRPGGELHIASDVWDVALEIMEVVEGCTQLRNRIEPWSFWRGNPFDAQSRREDTTLRRGQRVWRMRYALAED